MDPVRVLYIAGIGRSGSTLLCRTLGAVDGFVAVGEVMRFFNRGVLNDDLCSCGSPVRECGLWREVRQLVERRCPDLDFASLERIRKRATEGWSSIGFFLVPTSVARKELDDYCRFLVALYDAIRTVTGARVVVDASKNLMFARLLADIPDLRPSILHLVRDGRGVAFSLMRKQTRPGTDGRREYLRQASPFVASILWVMANVMAESAGTRTGRYQLVRYEDFVADPLSTVRAILDDLEPGYGDAALPDIQGRVVRLSTDHLIASNPNRAWLGDVELCEDLAWRREMSRAARWLVTALTGPLFRRYGYAGLLGPRSQEPAADQF